MLFIYLVCLFIYLFLAEERGKQIPSPKYFKIQFRFLSSLHFEGVSQGTQPLSIMPPRALVHGLSDERLGPVCSPPSHKSATACLSVGNMGCLIPEPSPGNLGWQESGGSQFSMRPHAHRWRPASQMPFLTCCSAPMMVSSLHELGNYEAMVRTQDGLPNPIWLRGVQMVSGKGLGFCICQCTGFFYNMPRKQSVSGNTQMSSQPQQFATSSRHSLALKFKKKIIECSTFKNNFYSL